MSLQVKSNTLTGFEQPVAEAHRIVEARLSSCNWKDAEAFGLIIGSVIKDVKLLAKAFFHCGGMGNLDVCYYRPKIVVSALIPPRIIQRHLTFRE